MNQKGKQMLKKGKMYKGIPHNSGKYFIFMPIYGLNCEAELNINESIRHLTIKFGPYQIVGSFSEFKNMQYKELES